MQRVRQDKPRLSFRKFHAHILYNCGLSLLAFVLFALADVGFGAIIVVFRDTIQMRAWLQTLVLGYLTLVIFAEISVLDHIRLAFERDFEFAFEHGLRPIIGPTPVLTVAQSCIASFPINEHLEWLALDRPYGQAFPEAFRTITLNFGTYRACYLLRGAGFFICVLLGFPPSDDTNLVYASVYVWLTILFSTGFCIAILCIFASKNAPVYQNSKRKGE